jgi:hypothetical protein
MMLSFKMGVPLTKPLIAFAVVAGTVAISTPCINALWDKNRDQSRERDDFFTEMAKAENSRQPEPSQGQSLSFL